MVSKPGSSVCLGRWWISARKAGKSHSCLMKSVSLSIWFGGHSFNPVHPRRPWRDNVEGSSWGNIAWQWELGQTMQSHLVMNGWKNGKWLFFFFLAFWRYPPCICWLVQLARVKRKIRMSVCMLGLRLDGERRAGRQWRKDSVRFGSFPILRSALGSGVAPVNSVNCPCSSSHSPNPRRTAEKEKSGNLLMLSKISFISLIS